MKAATTVALVASAISAVYAQGQLIIQSPASLVQCQPALVSFSGGTAPYYISVIPGGQPGAAALSQFPTQNGNTYTWTVDQPSGTSITLQIRDSTGNVNYSSQVDVQASSDSSCLNGGGSGSSSRSSAASSSGSSSSSSAPSSRTPLTSSTGSSSSAGTTTSAPSSETSGRNANANTASTSAPSSSPTGAASKYFANIAGVAGVAAIVALVL